MKTVLPRRTLIFLGLLALIPVLAMLWRLKDLKIRRPRTPETYYFGFPPHTPGSLRILLKRAADAYNTPMRVLEAVAYIEGKHLWDIDPIDFARWSREGGQDPINCQPNDCGARGPMQFLTGEAKDCHKPKEEQPCPAVCNDDGTSLDTWTSWANSSPYETHHVCNIEDAIYAASAKLSANSGASTNNWNNNQVKNAIRRYYGTCSDCDANPTAVDCQRLGMSYCDYVLRWYRGYSTPTPPGDEGRPTGNKFGLNVAEKQEHVDRELARFVGQGGWVVMMPPATNYSDDTANTVKDEIIGSFFSKMGSQVNYILRAHHPHATNPDFTGHPTFPDQSDPGGWAEKWADFWAGIINNLPIPSGSQFYVVPWNEPNLQRECAGIGNAYDPNDCGCAQYVLDYTDKLLSKLDRGKVKVLTPGFAVSAPNFWNPDTGGFIGCLGGSSYFDRFDGVSLQYYDFETNCDGKPFCEQDARLNPDKYPELLNNIGAGGKPLFITETGLVSPGECGEGVPDCPNFTQPDITMMLCELYNRHKSDSQLVMFSPLTYNPESDWFANWFWDTYQTQEFYLERYDDCSLIEKEVKEPLPIGGSSRVCSTFDQERTDDLGTSYTFLEASSGTIRDERDLGGAVEFEYVKFPNFSTFRKTMVNALKRTLPYKHVQELYLPESTTLFFKHFVQGQNEQGYFSSEHTTSCNDSPGAEAKVPAGLWGKLAGAIRGLCTYMGLCQPVSKYQFELEKVDPLFSCNYGFCAPGKEVEGVNLKHEPKGTGFSTTTWGDLTETVKEIEPGFWQVDAKFHKEARFMQSAQLAGAGETAQNAEFFYTRLTPQVIDEVEPEDMARALSTDFETSVAILPGHDVQVESEGSWYDLRKIRNLYCMNLCTITPADVEISDRDPICPSCDPEHEAYQDPIYSIFPLPEPADTHELCQWDEWVGGCDMWDPNFCANHRPDDPTCDACQLCEGCKCLPEGYPEPGKFICDPEQDPERCDLSCTDKCRREGFEPNPHPDPGFADRFAGYGACRFKNPDVCVRNDWGGDCAKVCNWACCAFQN